MFSNNSVQPLRTEIFIFFFLFFHMKMSIELVCSGESPENILSWILLLLAYLSNFFAPRTPNYDFRNTKKKLMLPNPRTDYLKCSFSYSGAILLNNLPGEIHTSNSLGFFKRSSHRWFLISTLKCQICNNYIFDI